MAGQMCWLAKFGEGRLILHLREESYRPWMPYTASPHKVPDLQIPGASKGWTTYQSLKQLGWTLVPTNEAYSAKWKTEVPTVRV